MRRKVGSKYNLAAREFVIIAFKDLNSPSFKTKGGKQYGDMNIYPTSIHNNYYGLGESMKKIF